MSVILAKHQELFQFLADYFNAEAFGGNDDTENALDLLDIAMEELFDEEYDYQYIQDVLKQTESFLILPLQDVAKALYVRQHVGVELPGLTPLEFLRFFYYRMKTERWRKR